LGIYLDTSFLIGLFVATDAFAGRAKTFYTTAEDRFIVSDYATAEFASVISKLTRMSVVTRGEAARIFDDFDAWRARSADPEDVDGVDVRLATAIIRRLDLNIRAPDAINLAIAQRLGASIATFDLGLSDNAAGLGISVAAA
jgi:uncharacterized protein